MTTGCSRALLVGAYASQMLFCVATLLAAEPKANGAPSKAAATVTRPRPKITISKETTYLTEPLRADGMVDYVAAVNQRFSAGVTPENNAAVLFLRALGPKKIDRNIRKTFFKHLRMAELPDEGEYLIPCEDFLQTRMGWKVPGGDTPDDLEKTQQMADKVWRACHVPWSNEEYPFLAELLQANVRPLRLITEGSQRSRFYVPLISTKPGSFRPLVMLTGLPWATEQLAARATWRLRNHQLDLAWDEVMAGFRLARLTGRGPFVVDSLLAVRCECQVFPAAIALAQYGVITVGLARRWQAELHNLPARRSLVDALGYGCRLESLAITSSAAERGYQRPNALAKVGLPPDPTFKAMFGLDEVHQRAYQLYSTDPRLDWNEALRYVNVWYDRLVAACRQPSYRRRRDALMQLAAEAKRRGGQALQRASLPLNSPMRDDLFTALVKAIKKDDRAARAAKKGDLRWLYEIASKRDAEARKETEQAVRRASLPRDLTPKQIAQHFVDLVLGPDWEVGEYMLKPDIEEQARMSLLDLALALAAYHHDHASYPKTLGELAPKYIADIPCDPATDRALRYRRWIGGYRLYSVGPNGKDDGGRNFHEEVDATGRVGDLSWDDIAIRMPPRNYSKQ